MKRDRGEEIIQRKIAQQENDGTADTDSLWVRLDERMNKTGNKIPWRYYSVAAAVAAVIVCLSAWLLQKPADSSIAAVQHIERTERLAPKEALPHLQVTLPAAQHAVSVTRQRNEAHAKRPLKEGNELDVANRPPDATLLMDREDAATYGLYAGTEQEEQEEDDDDNDINNYFLY